MLFRALLNSSTNLHDSMLLAVLKAPIFFFDTNPTGRILNRFSRDIGIMDELLPDAFVDCVQLVLFCIGSVLLLSVLNPWVLLGAIPLITAFVFLGRYYLKTSRELKRLEGLNRSPVIAHFSDTLDGLVTIRAFQREGAFMEELYRFGYFRNVLLGKKSRSDWLQPTIHTSSIHLFIHSFIHLPILLERFG